MNTNVLKFIDAGPAAAVCRLLSRRQREPLSAVATPPEGRFLAIRPGGMGDMIMLLPTLKRLRAAFPERTIDILCERRNAGVVQLAGIGAECLLYDTEPVKTLSRLRRRRYAAVFDTEQFHHLSAVVTALSGAPIRIGFMVAPKRNGLYTHLRDYRLDGREDRQFHGLLRPLGIEGPFPELPGLLREIPPVALPPEVERTVTEPVLAIHPGGTAPAKRIPAELLVAVAREARRRMGLAIALLGGKADAPAAREFASRADFPFRNYCGAFSLAMTAAFLRRTAVFLGPDSGPAHLATALGVPRATIFGPSDPRKWSIPAPGQRILRVPLACSPCSIFGYLKPCARPACMQRISPEDVLGALQSLSAPARQ